MVLKTVRFLCETISAYWYTINQGIQIHCEWFNENNLRNLLVTKIKLIAALRILELSFGLIDIFPNSKHCVKPLLAFSNKLCSQNYL